MWTKYFVVSSLRASTRRLVALLLDAAAPALLKVLDASCHNRVVVFMTASCSTRTVVTDTRSTQDTPTTCPAPTIAELVNKVLNSVWSSVSGMKVPPEEAGNEGAATHGTNVLSTAAMVVWLVHDVVASQYPSCTNAGDDAPNAPHP